MADRQARRARALNLRRHPPRSGGWVGMNWRTRREHGDRSCLAAKKSRRVSAGAVGAAMEVPVPRRSGRRRYSGKPGLTRSKSPEGQLQDRSRAHARRRGQCHQRRSVQPEPLVRRSRPSLRAQPRPGTPSCSQSGRGQARPSCSRRCGRRAAQRDTPQPHRQEASANRPPFGGSGVL